MDIRGRRILVTGASGGIGGATARRLAREGALLALTGRSVERLEAVVDACGRDRAVWTATADLTEEGAPARLAREAWESFGPLDAAVMCAGAPLRRSLDRVSVTDLQHALRVNFLAPAALLIALLPLMRGRPEGVVVVVGSSGGRVGTPGQAAYAASKFALTGFLEVAAIELAGTNVAVRLVQPGAVDTPLWTAPGNDPPLHTGERRPPEDVADAVVAALRAENGFESFVPPEVADVVARSLADVESSLARRAAWYRDRLRAPEGGEGSR